MAIGGSSYEQGYGSYGDSIDFRSRKSYDVFPHIKRLSDQVNLPLPVSLEDFKAYNRITTTKEDALIMSFIASSRRIIEDYANIVFTIQNFTATYDSLNKGIFNGGILIPFIPFRQITEVRTVDYDGVKTIVDTSGYYVNKSSDLIDARLYFLNTFDFDSTQRVPMFLEIDYQAGYDDVGSIQMVDWPLAVNQMTSTLYYNREAFNGNLPETIEGIMRKYRRAF